MEETEDIIIIILSIVVGGDLLDAVGANVLLLLLLRVLSDHFSPARLTNEAAKRGRRGLRRGGEGAG